MASIKGFILEKEIELGGILFDVLSNRRVSLSQSTTDNPVEDGSVISDFTIQAPVVISLKVEIGNVNIYDTEKAVGENAQVGFEKLEKLYENRVFISYQTGFRLYEDMIITFIGLVDEITKPGALIADISLKQIKIVDSEQVKIPPSILKAGKAKKQMSSEVNAGRVEPEPVLTAEEAEKQFIDSFNL